jgi:hypothetical protein
LDRILVAVAMCAAMALPGPAAAAISVVGPAVQRLHLSAQQLLSLRDVLSGVERGAQVEASGEGLFVLRDPGSMAYMGEFSVVVAAGGTLTVDRIGGPATLDASQAVALPIRLNPKTKAQILGALAGSQILATDAASQQPPALPEERIAALKFTDARIAGPLLQTRATFFRDGSGVVRTIRAPQMATTGGAPAPLRVSDRYLSAIKSDGTHVWRDNVVEIDSDVSLNLSELETHVCPATGPCSTRRPAVASTGFHLIRWQHQLIAAVPPSLLGQLAPAPAPEAAAPPARTETPSQTPAAPSESLSPAGGGDLPGGLPPENTPGH